MLPDDSGDDNNQEDSEQLKESRMQFFYCLVAVIALTFINVSIPVFTIAVVIIWPLPVVYLALHQGQRRAVMMIVMAAVINGLLFSPLMSITTVVGFGFIGFVMAGGLIEKFTPRRVLFMTVGAAILSNLILSGILISTYEQGLEAGFAGMLEELAGPLMGEEELSPLIQMQMRLITQLLPALLIISGAITGILNYYFVHWFLRLKNIDVIPFKSIAYWRFPAALLSAGAVIGLLFRDRPSMFNLAAVVFFLIFLQGFGVGLYYTVRKTSSMIFRWIYILAVLIIPVVPVALLAVGLLDLWLDFRRIAFSRGED